MDYLKKYDNLCKINNELLKLLLPAVDMSKVDKKKLKKLHAKFNNLKSKVCATDLKK